MTLLVWLGSKLERARSNGRNNDCARAASGRAGGSVHSSTVKQMEPAPPG
jgi:hypothetical protein